MSTVSIAISRTRRLVEALRGKALQLHHHDAQEEIEEMAEGLQIVLDGAIVRHRFLSDGRCQGVAIYYRDDIFNLGRYLDDVDFGDVLVALKGTVTASVHPEDLAELIGPQAEGPGLPALVLRELNIARERVISLGQRSSLESMAHFLCETMIRNRSRHANSSQLSCRLALSQDMLGGILGISAVHTNRTLKELRALGLADHSDHLLTIHDFGGLARVGGFDDGYLAA